MRYAVVIEKADGNYSAYVPDRVATGERQSRTKFARRSASISTAFRPMAS